MRDLRRSIQWITTILIFSGSASALADTDPRQVLVDSQTALLALKGVRYEVEADAHGPLAIRYPRIAGTVRMARDIGGGRAAFAADLNITPRSDKAPYRFEVANDSQTVTAADHGEKTFASLALPDGARIIGPASLVIVGDFAAPTPYERELKDASLSHVGSEDIHGADCDVVLCDLGREGKVRWCISKKDRLPRGVDRIRPSPVGETTQILRIREIETNPSLGQAAFAVKKPDNYGDALAQRPQNRASANGNAAAPEWTLKDADGKEVSLKSLRGRIVLLDFWATWCGPCKLAMPGVERIHTKFKDKPVSVYGVVTWERPGGDPAGFMKRNNYTYPLLFKGDDLARQYGFNGIPAFVLIGPDGTILHRSSGYSPTAEKQIEAAIEAAIANLEKAKP